MQNTALHLAERSLLRYAIADEKTQPHTDVDMTMLSVFQLLPVPDPSWVQLRLARMMLWQKVFPVSADFCFYLVLIISPSILQRYNEAVSKYGELLNSPLCSKKAEERKGKFPIMCLPDFEVFAHEHALGLLLSNKIDELRQLCASSNTLDFVMLIIQTEMFMKLRMFEDAVKTLNR